MRKNRKKNIFLLLFVLLCSLGIGYAFLRTELQINGTADFLDARWDIHFANLVVNPNSVELSTGNTAASISTSTTEVSYAVTLKEPGDFYEFTVDAVNAGTIDGMIDTISSKMGGVEITTLPAYMEYSVTYSDGVQLIPNQYLKVGETETYKVHIGFKKDISASDLTGQVESKTFSFSVAYIQADQNAITRPKTFAQDSLDTVISVLKSGDITPYKVGHERNITLDTLGIHRLRIANSTTPGECLSEGFSQTACGVVLEFVDAITTYCISNTNVGGWPASEKRTYVNSDIYNTLPESLKNAIIDTTVVSGHGSSSGETNFISIDKLYLLSAMEVWGNNSFSINDSARDLSRQLDYYSNLGVNNNNYSSAIKKRDSHNVFWWLRTADSRNSDYFDYVTNFGANSSYGPSSCYGLSPAFRIA